MKRILAFAMCVLLSFFALLPGTQSVTSQEETSATAPAKFLRSENPLPDRYLVILLNTIEETQLESTASVLAQQYGGTVLTCPYSPGIHGFSVQMTEPNAVALSQDARVQYVQEIPAAGFGNGASYEQRTNFALAENGGHTLASSSYGSGYAAEGAINGDRRGINWGAGGGWNDATPDQYPDQWWVDFNGPKRISEVNIFTVQDNYIDPREPTVDMTFSLYGLIDFDVYYMNSSGQFVTLEAVRGNNRVWRQIKFEPVTTTKIFIHVYNALGYSRIAEVEALGTASTNVALAANGGQTLASSTFGSGYPASAAINGDRRGTNWGNGGGWNDATADQYPDQWWVDFNGPKRINEVNIFTVQDNYTNPQEPTLDMTFTLHGIIDFDVYYMNSSGQFVTLEAVRGNNKVWRQIKFEPVITTKIFIHVYNARGHSRLTEVEAWEAPPPPPKSTNVALASNGGKAFASTTLSAAYPVAAIINGERRGSGWAAGTGGWHDATANVFPDYLELHFAGEKRINEIDLFTLQDNYPNPSEPHAEMTFSQFGVTAFRINYWDTATAQWMILTDVQGNNKVWRNVQFPVIKTPKLSIMILNGANNHSRVVEIEAWEAPAATNVALSENGGQAYASSTYSAAYPVSALINGERRGTGWANGTGGWHDATANSFPDYLELHFNGEKRIHEIDFFTLQDNYNYPSMPTSETTFTQFGVTAFRVNYWDSVNNQWVMLTEIQGNNNVWRKLEFDPIQTPKLSIMVLNGAQSYSRVVEIEAWQAADAEVTPPDLAELPPPEPEPDGQFAETFLPAQPPHRLMKSTNPRYFKYNNQTVSLFGISGSYLPHVARHRPRTPNGDTIIDPVKENCTFDFVGGQQKYQKCVNLIKDAGLNHIQIWVVLNHSVGKLPIEQGTDPSTGSDPYPNEQPFNWNSQTKKWNLNKSVVLDQDPNNDLTGFNDTFFANLKSVVKYCEERDVLVGVVLFDPWSGEVDGQPKLSPWFGANNTDNFAFTNRSFFVMAENTSANPEGTEIDSTQKNKDLRKIQVALMKRTAFELQDLKNFYWVLANEPDMDGRASGPGLVIWHKYMANQLRKYETDKLGGKVHLIGATLTTNAAGTNGSITALRAYPKIDMIASHYVHLDTKGSLPASIRYSAIRVLRTFNAYQSPAVPVAANNEIWGFNEGRYTGNKVEDGQTDTAASARVEAWEFLMNGGGVYDHLSYRWANSTAEDNARPMPGAARTYFKYLSKFMGGISLDNMHRFTTNQLSGWLKTYPPENPRPSDNAELNSPYWAAMSNGTHYFYYVHRSKRFGVKSDRYRVYTGTIAADASIVVQKSGMGTGCFRAEWFYPDGKPINGQGGVSSTGVLLAAKTFPFFFTTNSTTQQLAGPVYKQDLVLRITKRPGVTQPNCN